MKKFIAGAILFGFVIASNAQPVNSIYSGNKLYEQLTGDTLSQLQATSYIVGAIDMVIPAYCIPSHVPIGKLVELIKTALQNNPANRHKPAAEFVIAILKKEYSCKQENPQSERGNGPPLEDRLRNPRSNKTFI